MPIKKTAEKVYRFPANLRMFVLALLACNIAVSNFRCNEQEGPVCPVEYNVVMGDNLPLTGKWTFIGFENPRTKEIEYPPCGDNSTFIILTDSTHSRPEKEIFKYPYVFQGRTLINSFIGSFATEDEDKIVFSETIKSHVNGTGQLEDFQEQFHFALSTAETFDIENNLLRISFDNGRRDLLFFSTNDTIVF
jgi:hypothetical protein